ncbi:hypothetical protein A7975_18690 [Bacillus sp. FJAT-26390]|nr:hypothetical protein A7975_18690 [Bacillus sp. FJAT-26390]
MDAGVHTICCFTRSNGLAFQGSHLNDNFLLWSLLPYAVWKKYFQVKDQAYYDQNQPDERKDGGKYIVNASIVYSEEEYKTNLPDYEIVRKFKAKANQIYEDMIVIWRRDSPSFISDKEIVYKAMVDGSTLIFAVMEDLERKGRLPAPAVAEKCRLGTIVWRLPDKA